ncbi:hypothetical protein AC629_01975 [Bradyrhizobium sp. NAS80.1]|nr:hypothetical protein AC629_01975 [Bradyrhizobium sp. NAS80.1]
MSVQSWGFRALRAAGKKSRSEVADDLTNPEDPLFSEAAEETFGALRAHILRLEREAEAERR